MRGRRPNQQAAKRREKTLAKSALVYMLSNLPNGPPPFHKNCESSVLITRPL